MKACECEMHVEGDDCPKKAEWEVTDTDPDGVVTTTYSCTPCLGGVARYTLAGVSRPLTVKEYYG